MVGLDDLDESKKFKRLFLSASTQALRFYLFVTNIVEIQSLQKLNLTKLRRNFVYLVTSDITKISRSSTRKSQIESHGGKEYSQYMFDK